MEGYFILYWIISLIIGALLAIIPANLAKNKGYSFGLWWFYGWMLFIVAIIHVSLIPDKNLAPSKTYRSAADELKGYKDLLDMGAITEDEFTEKKRQLLNM